MSKKSKIQSKEFSNTLRECVLQLKKIKEDNGLLKKQDVSIKEDSEIVSENISNTNSTEIKNAWGQKDPNSIIKEKNERLKFLERELEESKLQYQRLEQEKKRAKIEFEKEQKDSHYEKVLQEKNKEMSNLLIENDLNRRKISELESQMEQEKTANKILKEANDYMVEVNNKKPVNLHKREYLLNLKNFLENDQEILKLQKTNGNTEKELEQLRENHSQCSKIIESYKSLIIDLENRLKFKTFSNEIKLNEIESVLMEEIDSITNAFDKISKTNLLLEKTLVETNSKITEMINENYMLKNKLNVHDENRSFLEKEKKRLEEWKSILLEETKIFQEKCIETEGTMIEKESKIVNYKLLLTSLQSNLKKNEEELKNTHTKYKNTMKELEVLKSELIHMKTEFDTNKKICDLLKGFCSSDTELIEDLERYKKVLRCGLCDTNLKNCLLVKCSHTFCDSCINDRFKARQRKCPNCQCEFNQNDIKKMYL